MVSTPQHIVKKCHLMRHFFVCGWRQNKPIGIDYQYITQQYACFRFCLHPQNYKKPSFKNKAFLSKWYFFAFFHQKIIYNDGISYEYRFRMILKWNYAFIMKILELFRFDAQILIAHSSSVFRDIGLHFSLKCLKRYILRYQFVKLDKNAKIMMSIFNG